MTITLLIKKHACKSEKNHDNSILWNPSGFAQASAGNARIRSRTAPLQRNQQCLMQNAPVQSRTWPDVHIENTLITLPKAIKTLLIRWLQVLKNKQTKALKRTGEKHFWEDIKSIWHFSDYFTTGLKGKDSFLSSWWWITHSTLISLKIFLKGAIQCNKRAKIWPTICLLLLWKEMQLVPEYHQFWLKSMGASQYWVLQNTLQTQGPWVQHCIITLLRLQSSKLTLFPWWMTDYFPR